jgi:hypothetical protein
MSTLTTSQTLPSPAKISIENFPPLPSFHPPLSFSLAYTISHIVHDYKVALNYYSAKRDIRTRNNC